MRVRPTFSTLNLSAVVPNHCSGNHKCSLASLEVLPDKVKIITISYKFFYIYERFSNHFIVRCTATLKRWENTALVGQPSLVGHLKGITFQSNILLCVK